jgi:hypothetical protein
MLGLYCVSGDQWEEYFRLFDEAQEPGWWRAYGLDNMGYVPLEADASLVREFALVVVPGLLQTVDYARALFVGAEDRPADQLRNAVIVRTIRRKRLRSADDPLELVVVLAEMALHHPAGGPEVMAEQLDHLVEAAELDTVTLRVLPVSVGAHVGMSGAFTLLSFGELGEPDVLYTENLGGSSFSEKERAISRLHWRTSGCSPRHLSPDDSVALIRRVAQRYRGQADRSAPDGPQRSPVAQEQRQRGERQ